MVAACDSEIGGAEFENMAPQTELSVRDTSLVDNLGANDRFSSTIFVSWTGDDSDGFVASFDVRFFDESENPGPEELWTETTSTDSLVLLPIPRGFNDANVTFQVRATDNEGLKDPTPATTVFPIQNAPPDLRLGSFDLPPDTTFGLISIAWVATDPEGPENLARIEIALNDSVNFVALDPAIDYITLVADVDRNDPAQTVAEARVFEGRGFAGTDVFVPGLLLDNDNTLYLRAVDQTDTTSATVSFSWFVKKSQSDILVVNDYRKVSSPLIMDYHLGVLEEYLPDGKAVDIWTITTPFFQGSAGNVPRSDLLPPSADPTITQMLAEYKHIYWVTTASINSISSNNLPFVAPVLDGFFSNGGTMMVHSPVSLPANPEDNLGNPALLLLPVDNLISFPDSLRPQLRLTQGAKMNATNEVPGTGLQMPTLVSEVFLVAILPYEATGANTIPLADAEFTYVTRSSATGPWTGHSTVASISNDRRVGLFSLPLINEASGAIQFVGEDGNQDGARDAIHLLLESLNFPGK